MLKTKQESLNGLILSGGGARAAYQVGVLRAIADILPEPKENPFQIIVGTSAGAINSVGLACGAMDYQAATKNLQQVWESFSSDKVYRTDWAGVLGQASRFVRQHLLGFGRSLPVALLDNSPLQRLLSEQLDFSGIKMALARRKLLAVGVTAFSYQSAQATTFFQSRKHIEPWLRHRRAGQPVSLDVKHLLASSAIPLVFPPVKLAHEFYGDGAVRQIAPISPALHLGASRVLIIGVDATVAEQKMLQVHPPSLAQISGHLLSSTFSDSLQNDLELLQRLNHLGALLTDEQREHEHGLSPIQTLVIAPSKPIEEIAVRHRHQLATSLRVFLKGSGAMRSTGGAVLSYLLFERDYCSELIELGYQDALARRVEIKDFLQLNDQERTPS